MAASSDVNPPAEEREPELEEDEELEGDDDEDFEDEDEEEDVDEGEEEDPDDEVDADPGVVPPKEDEEAPPRRRGLRPLEAVPAPVAAPPPKTEDTGDFWNFTKAATPGERVRVIRRAPREWRDVAGVDRKISGYCGEHSPDLTLDRMQELYGGGTYMLELIGVNGRIRKTAWQEIAGEPRMLPAAVPGGPTRTNGAPPAGVASLDEWLRIQQTLRPQGDGLSDKLVLLLVEDLLKQRQADVSPADEGDPLDRMLERAAKVAEISRAFAGGGFGAPPRPAGGMISEVIGMIPKEVFVNLSEALLTMVRGRVGAPPGAPAVISGPLVKQEAEAPPPVIRPDLATAPRWEPMARELTGKVVAGAHQQGQTPAELADEIRKRAGLLASVLNGWDFPRLMEFLQGKLNGPWLEALQDPSIRAYLEATLRELQGPAVKPESN